MLSVYLQLAMMSYSAQIDEQNVKEYDKLRRNQERGQTEIIGCAPITNDYLIDVRLSPTKSLLQDDNDGNEEIPPNETHEAVHTSTTRKPYSVLLKLVNGSLVGTIDYNCVYENSEAMVDIDETCPRLDDLQVPKLTDIARKVAQCRGTQMNEKQYIAYEVKCCTFILGLTNNSQDNNSLSGSHLQQALPNNSNKKTGKTC